MAVRSPCAVTVRDRGLAVGFFNVVAWNRLADNVSSSLTKGSRAAVAGKLVQRSWQTKDGSKRYSVEILASHVSADLSFATVEITKNPAGASPAPAGKAG